MKFVRTILLVLVMLGACGCTINIPDPPDIEIHGEVNNGNGSDDANGANGTVETRREK